MSTKTKRGLGRNLNVLLSKPVTDILAVPSATKTLPIEFLKPGKFQPRRTFSKEALSELSASIKAQGIIQPIVVRPLSDNQYEIIAGERRWRAAQQASLSNVPVVIQDIDDKTTMALSLIENIQREDLNPLEEARGLERLINEFNLTHQEISEAIGKSRATVSNLLRLQQLNPDVKAYLEQGVITLGHAKVLLALTGRAQSELANQIVKNQLSVRQTEQLVQHPLKTAKPTPQKDPDIQRLENKLSDKLGAQVLVQHQTKGCGKLVIHYNTLDELDGILDKIH